MPTPLRSLHWVAYYRYFLLPIFSFFCSLIHRYSEVLCQISVCSKPGGRSQISALKCRKWRLPDGFGEGVGHVARGDEGLIIQEGEEYRLNDVYVAMKLRARKKINEKIKLTDRQKMVIDYILNNQLVNALILV